MTAVPPKTWTKRLTGEEPGARDLIEALRSQEKLTPVAAGILLARCRYNAEVAKRFLYPRLQDLRSPQLLPDIEKAVSRIEQALKNGEKIVVHGDYDVDGISAVAIMVRGLKEMGAEIYPFIPEREIDGYGLSQRGIDFCKETEAKILLTCDCGTSAVDEVALANSRGIDVIITDHHLPGKTLPAAFAIVNPNRLDSTFPFGGLCGAGVAFYLLMALRTRLREAGYFKEACLNEPDLRAYLGILALAVVADSVPLLEENRIFVSKGLAALALPSFPGIQALLELTQLVRQPLTTWDLAFKLVPRLNCGGRMGRAQLSLDLLLENDLEKARKIARELEGLNSERRKLEERIRQEAIRQIESDPVLAAMPAIVVFGDNWPKGVIGIVAAKLAEKFHKIAVVVGMQGDEGVGSLRGVPGLNLVDMIAESEELLERFGGHEGAAGLTIKRENLLTFRERFSQSVNKHLQTKKVSPQLQFDETLDLGQLSSELLADLERLEPFGMGNPEPLFTSDEVEVCEARLVGEGERHLKMRFRQGSAVREAIGFGLGERLGQNLPQMGSRIHIAYTTRWNEFRGSKTIQIEVKDLK